MLIKRIGRLFAVFVLSGVSSVVLSQTFTFNDALELMDEDGHVTIPDGYTEIGQNAFKSTAVVSVTIPSTVSSMGSYAFSNTPKLEEIVIPDSITSIPNSAFSYSGLKKITLHSNITSIGDSAFYASDISEIDLPENITIGDSAFRYTNIVHLKLPNGTILDKYSFADLGDSLISLEIGENVSWSSSNQLFYRSGSNLKTIVTSSVIGCSARQGICPGDDRGLPKLKFVVFKGNQNTTYYQDISISSAVIVLQSGSNISISGGLSSSEVIVVSPTSISGPINSSPHTYCSGVDSDEDGFPDCYDQFPNDPDRWFDYSDSAETNTSDLVHSDGDGLADIFDRNPTSSQYPSSNDWDNSETTIDTDGDNIHNAQDIDDDDDGLLDIYEPFFGTNPLIPDSDFDGTLDSLDAFPLDNTESLDTDSDGIGNNADTDDDNDGYTDFLDAFPTDTTEWADSDSDGIGNNSDLDDDNDGVADTEDAFPHTASESLDSDNDGVGDNADAFPNDSTEVADTDLDGIGNNADPDDDNDGVADADDGDPLNADIGTQPSQLISVAGNPVGVNGHSTRISLSYDTSDGNNQLPGIGFRLHYSSEMLSFAGTENSIANDIIVDGDGPYQDDSDFDNDLNTDKYIIFGWAALNGDWPNSSLPASLVDVVLNVSWEAFDQASITTPINFSKVSTTEGYNFEATNYTLNVLPATWDFDGNGQADALTDGLILLRHAFGVRGASLTDSVMATDSTMTPEEVQVAVEKALVIADIDGSGSVDALTDGLILLRYMFGLTGETLMDSVVSANATRASVESIQQYIELYMPNDLLLPVQSEPSFIVGDWKLEKTPEKKNVYSWTEEFQAASDIYHFGSCIADDIYRFGVNGTFEYFLNGSTFMDAAIHPADSPIPGNSCISPPAPWSEGDVYSYSIDEDNKQLIVIGTGAYIGLQHVANGTDDIQNPTQAPESITYTYNLISDNNLILEVDTWHGIYRYTLERVIDN